MFVHYPDKLIATESINMDELKSPDKVERGFPEIEDIANIVKSIEDLRKSRNLSVGELVARLKQKETGKDD